jgi:hypothetical protein
MPGKPYPSKAEVLAIDEELAAEGVPVVDRATQAMLRWMQTPPFYDGVVDLVGQGRWFEDRWKELHPSVATTDRPFMYLAVSALGVSYRCDPPIIFGTVGINPMALIKMRPEESECIWAPAPHLWWELHHQAVDCIDLFLNRLEFTGSEDAHRRKSVAMSQLEATARQLVACAHDASLPQAVSLIAEMAMKAALASKGIDEGVLKRKIGHDLTLAAKMLAEATPSETDGDLIAVAASLPDYKAVRYDPPNLTTSEAQDYYRRALFVAAEALRRVGHHRTADAVRHDPSIPIRQWSGIPSA